MNRIYKSIWNYATRTFTAVSEIQQSKGKKTKSRQVAAALGAVTVLLGSLSGSTLAETIHWGSGGIGEEIDLSVGIGTGSFVIGSSSPAYNYGEDDVDIADGTYSIIVDQPQSALDLSSENVNLFDQSAGSSYKFIAAPSGISGWPSGLRAEDISLQVRNGNTDNFQQTIRQNGANVATATYAIGDAAADLFLNHAGNDGLNGSIDYELEWFQQVPVRVDLDGTKFDISTGINVNHSGGDGGDGYAADDGLSTLVVLKSLSLAANQKLTLHAGANQKWFASLNGEGSIAYVGEGKEASSVNIRNLFDSLANTYTGTTELTDITLNLYRENSLGSNALVTATDAVINTESANAFSFAKALDYENTDHNFASGQTAFNVNNAQGTAAQFTGTNRFTAVSGNPFAFNVAGNMNVGSTESIGSASFSNTSGGGINLLVNGDLTVFAGSAVNGANDVAVGENLNLYNVSGIDASSTLTVGTSLNFIDANGTFSHDAGHAAGGKFAVSLSNSNVVYDDGLSVAVSDTTIKDESTLTVTATSYVDQLGSSVVFQRDTDDNRSQLIVTGEDGSGRLDFGNIKLVGDGLTVLRGSDADTAIGLGDQIDLSQYKGWIRAETGSFTLDQAAADKLNGNDSGKAATGLSIGSGSMAKVSGTTAVELDRFGWSTQSAGGVLDLSGFEFSDENSPALKIDELYFGYENTVRVDLNDITYSENIREGNIFALNQSERQQLLVEGTWVGGGSSNLVLQDGNGDEVSATETTILKNVDNQANNAATVDWSLDAEYYYAAGNSPAGIYLDYSVTSVSLLNGEDSAPTADTVLDKESALVAVGTDEYNSMTAKITGHGILELRYDDTASTGSARKVSLNNNESTYTGATVVRDNVSLESTFEALGSSVLVLAGNDSNYSLRPGSGTDPGESVEIKLQGIATGSGAHQIAFGSGHMTIVGDGIKAQDLAEIKGYDQTLQSGNVLGAATTLAGTEQSVFELSGTTLKAESANVFNGYSGRVLLSGEDAALTITGNEALTSGRYATAAGASNSAVTLDVDATFSAEGADFSGFSGTINTSEHTYTVSENDGLTRLGSSAIVTDNSTIVFSGIDGNFVNAVTQAAGGAASTWNLTNGSNVTLDSASGGKSGIDHVSISGDSSLTLVEATDSQTEGGLEKLADGAAFTGAGTLNLSGYALESDDLTFVKEGETFTGTLGLQDQSRYTLLESAGYAVTLNEGTLVVGSETVGNTLGLNGKSLYVSGADNVLDLTQAVANDDGALFTAQSVEAKGDGAALTIKISNEQQSEALQEKNLLDQDEGGFGRLLVDAAAAASQNADLTVQVGDDVVGADNQAVEITIDTAGLVTGTYERSAGYEADGDIALTYKLTALAVKADANSPGTEVVVLKPDAEASASRDLNVKLTGNGVIGIDGTNGSVSIAYQKGSRFTGTFKADAQGDNLTVSGTNTATAAAVLSNGGSLTVYDTQTLVVEANNAKLNLGDAITSAELVISGSGSTITNTSVSGSEGSLLKLKSDAQAEISGALADNLRTYAGTISLDSRSVLTLKNTGSDAYAINRITGVDWSTLSLAEGEYVWGADHETFAGTVRLDGSLTLDGWTANNTDFTGDASTTGIAGTGTVNIGGTGSSTVLMDADRIAGFTGTMAVGSGSTLHVNADTDAEATKDFFAQDAAVKLAADGTLEVANGGNDSAVFDTNVAVDVASGGTFRVTQGSVTLDDSITIDADATDVVSGASLKVKGGNDKLSTQIGDTVTLGGTLRIEATGGVTLDNKTVLSESNEHAGTIHVDLGATGNELKIGSNLNAADFDGKLRLSNGTYTFSQNVPANGIHNFAVGAGGQFNVTGSETIQLDSFAWEYAAAGQTAGVLDITGYHSADGDPALSVGYLELNGSGSIKLDVDDWIQGLDATTGKGNILDLDERGNGNLVISVWDSTWLDAATDGYLTLIDVSGDNHTQTTNLEDAAGQKIAVATWDYRLGKNELGVYIGYDIASIKLMNADDESLGALVLKADQGGDDKLSAAITGSGRISVESDVTILSAENDFSGTVTVAEGKTLTTTGSYVLSGKSANTVELALESGADYVMTARGEDAQDLARLKLNAGVNSKVTLNGNELTLIDGSTIGENAVFAAGTPDWTTSTVVAEGSVTMRSAGSTLANSDVDWTVGSAGTYVMEGADFTLADISSEDATAASSGGAILLNANASVGYLSQFVGTVRVADGKTVSFDLSETAAVKTLLNDKSLAVELSDSTLEVRGDLKLAGLSTSADSVIDLGSLEIGAETASGSLGFTDGNHPKLADGTTIRVAIDDQDGISNSEVFVLDDGRETALVSGLAADQGDLNLVATDSDGTALPDAANLSADLKNADGKTIGTAHYGLSLDTVRSGEETNVNAEFKLSSLDLTGILSLTTVEASTLDAVVTGTAESGLSIESDGITLAGSNTYGSLNVADDVTVDLTGTQTITGAGSMVSGTVSDANAAGDAPLLVVDGADAVLTFGSAQNALENGVAVSNGATVVFDGVNALTNALVAGGFTVNAGEGTVALKNSTGTLSIDDLHTELDADVRLSLEDSSYLLLSGTTDISGSVHADVGDSSGLMLQTDAANVDADWSNLTGTGTLVISGTGENKSSFTLGSLNDAFAGTIALDNFGVTLGGDNNPNNGLVAGNSSLLVHDSEVVLDGKTTVSKGMTVEDSTLVFTEDGRIERGGASSSLITVADGGTLALSGSATLVDMNGNALADTGSILVKDANGNKVAELGFGATLVGGETEGEDLWVGQAVREMRLYQSVELNADSVTPDASGIFNINVGVTSAADAINLTVSGDTPISLNRTGDISGTTTVKEGGTLILGADGALGVDDAQKGTEATDALIVHGTAALADSVTQTVHGLTLAQSGALQLGEEAELVVDADGEIAVDGTVTGDASSSVAFSEGAAVNVGTADKLSGMAGTWDLTKGASMSFDVAQGETEALAAGTIVGGKIVKTGAGELALGYDTVSREDANLTSIQIEEGVFDVTDWEGKTLSLQSLSLGRGTEFSLHGNLSTADGLTANGARIYVGDENYTGGDFHNRTINGGFSGSATFVFNTELSQIDSRGDRLTINGVSSGSIDLEVVNHSRLTSDEIDNLVLLRVEEIGADGLDVKALDFDADGYEFRLAETEADGYTNWYLTSSLDDPDNPGTDPDDPDNPGMDPDDPDNPGTDPDDKPGSEGHVISSRVGALAGFASTVDMFDLSIHDRQGTRPWVNPLTGEKTETSMWIRQTVSQTHSGDSTGQLGSRATTVVTQIGGDILQATSADGGYAFAGLMAGWGTSDYKTKSKVSGSHSRADTDGWTVGVYGGWHQNDPKVNRSGAYVNGWIQYSNFSSDVTWKGGDEMKARADGLSASLETGWIIPALDFRMDGGASRGHLYVEPHAQVTWWGAEYDDVKDADVSFYGKDNVTTRLGARFTVEVDGATTFSPYAEVNWVHNTEDYGARWGEGVSYVEGAGNQAEFKLGMEAAFTKSFSGYAQFRGNWGDDGYNRREGTIGLKYRW